MRGQPVKIDTLAVMQALGRPDKPSIGEVARELGIPESTLRSKTAKFEGPRDNVSRRIRWLRDQIEHLGDILGQLEADIVAEREFNAAERERIPSERAKSAAE
ncbi:MAG TPA: hypothetical protein VHW66_09350 [Stellaceae bacterium]|jgi:hypothetical protein|nr:hypothetical protein [Stellaceae bacterium]